jgi:DNA-binding LytR/AlgR family response regulator
MVETTNLNILVLDDDDMFIKLISLLLDNIGVKRVEYTQTIDEAFKTMEAFKPDVLILDINLDKNESGIEFAKMVNKGQDIPVIFITSNYSEDIYLEAKMTGPCQFLDKQLSELKLRQAIELTVLQTKKQEDDVIYQKIIQKPNLESGWFIKKGKYLRKVEIKDINWIESEGKYCTVFTDDTNYIVNLSLKEVADRLEPYEFVRIHRSFVVNKAKIQAIDLVGNLVKIFEKDFPIGRSYRSSLLSQLADF